MRVMGNLAEFMAVLLRARGVLPRPMTTISLNLPEHLLLRLEKESRARRTTKSSVVRECGQHPTSNIERAKRKGHTLGKAESRNGRSRKATSGRRLKAETGKLK